MDKGKPFETFGVIANGVKARVEFYSVDADKSGKKWIYEAHLTGAKCDEKPLLTVSQLDNESGRVAKSRFENSFAAYMKRCGWTYE